MLDYTGATAAGSATTHIFSTRPDSRAGLEAGSRFGKGFCARWTTCGRMSGCCRSDEPEASRVSRQDLEPAGRDTLPDWGRARARIARRAGFRSWSIRRRDYAAIYSEAYYRGRGADPAVDCF
jgi:hypothetical protein